MTPIRASQDFDVIASTYDVTRDPLDPETLDKVAEVLRTHDVRRILEVGVGTGRVAIPLDSRHFEVTGVDGSRNMLFRAREKGFRRTVLGDAYRLPFREGAFDVSFLVHVLHILEDPRAGLEEASRVSRQGAWAFVHPRLDVGGERADSWEVRRKVYRILAEDGFTVPPQGGGGPPLREQAILQEIPPDELIRLGDRMVTESFSKQLDMLAHGASRHTLHIPREALQRAVEIVRKEMGDQTFTYRKVEALARWSAASLSSKTDR